MTFADALIKYRRENKKSQEELAKIMGVSKAAISRYESGDRIPKLSAVVEFTKSIGLTVEQFLSDKDDIGKLDNVYPVHMKRIPVLGAVGAGDPRAADDEYGEFLNTDTDADFALRVDGDSMEPTIAKGDIALVKRQSDCDDGQIAVVLLDNEAVCKRVTHIPNGLILISDNAEKYHPRIIHGEGIKILGRVTQSVRCFR